MKRHEKIATIAIIAALALSGCAHPMVFEPTLPRATQATFQGDQYECNRDMMQTWPNDGIGQAIRGPAFIRECMAVKGWRER